MSNGSCDRPIPSNGSDGESAVLAFAPERCPGELAVYPLSPAAPSRRSPFFPCLGGPEFALAPPPTGGSDCRRGPRCLPCSPRRWREGRSRRRRAPMDPEPAVRTSQPARRECSGVVVRAAPVPACVETVAAGSGPCSEGAATAGGEGACGGGKPRQGSRSTRSGQQKAQVDFTEPDVRERAHAQRPGFVAPKIP